MDYSSWVSGKTPHDPPSIGDSRQLRWSATVQETLDKHIRPAPRKVDRLRQPYNAWVVVEFCAEAWIGLGARASVLLAISLHDSLFHPPQALLQHRSGTREVDTDVPFA